MFWGRRKPHCLSLAAFEGEQKQPAVSQERKERVGFNLEVEGHYGDASLTELILTSPSSHTDQLVATED